MARPAGPSCPGIGHASLPERPGLPGPVPPLKLRASPAEKTPAGWESGFVMSSVHPVVVVAYSEVPELADLELPDGSFILAGESHALGLIEQRPLGGLIVVADGAGVVARSRSLVVAYVRCQPQGCVAILSRAPAATLSTQLAFLSDRADVFFAPWDGYAIREFLRIPSRVPAGVG